MKRYYVYDYLIGSPVLIDTKEKVLIFYGKNIYGQIYNLDKLESEDIFKPGKQRINGLIKRANNRNYGYSNSYVTDRYIYNYIMTDEERAKIDRTISTNEREFVTSGDDLTEVLTTMIEWVLNDSGSVELSNEKIVDYRRLYKEKIQYVIDNNIEYSIGDAGCTPLFIDILGNVYSKY